MIKLTTDVVSLTLTDLESSVLIAALRGYEPPPEMRASGNKSRHKSAADFVRTLLTREESGCVEDV